MGFEVNMENLYKAFVIMVQGMAGIYVTINYYGSDHCDYKNDVR